MLQHIHTPSSPSCCPSPVWGWPYDSELERLRRLERETRNEEEKCRIRDLLRRRGVPEDVIQGRPAYYGGLYPGCQRSPTLQDVLRTIPSG